jgi:hypothetical protein
MEKMKEHPTKFSQQEDEGTSNSRKSSPRHIPDGELSFGEAEKHAQKIEDEYHHLNKCSTLGFALATSGKFKLLQNLFCLYIEKPLYEARHLNTY